MLRYLIRRLIGTIPTVFGVAVVIFLLFNVVGGDPVYVMVGRYATVQRIAEIRHEFGFDQPLIVQFWAYLKQLSTFDFGYSYASHQKISYLILSGIGPTLSIALPAFLFTTLTAILVALVVAYFRGRWVDRLVVILCVLGMSISILAYILFGQYVLAYKWGLYPVSGWDADWTARWAYVGLPVLIWVLVSLGYDVRFFRTAIIEETHQDYVRTARAKGLGEPAIFFKHVLKNSLIPIVTSVFTQIPALILGSFLLESFFQIPGLGGITIDAIRTSDSPVIRAMATMQAFVLIGANLLTDIIYTWVDPRVSLK